MKYDEINDSGFLQRMRDEIGYAAFLKFVEIAKLLGLETEAYQEEKESIRQNIDAKLDEILEYITSEKIPCDKGQLKSFLLKQLDDQYPSSTGVQQQNKNVKPKSTLPPKYTYKDENDKDRTWTGRGRMPDDLQKAIRAHCKKDIDFNNLTRKEKEELLKPFLTEKPTQQPN